MENTTLKETKKSANKLLSMVFGENIVNYDLGFKTYEEEYLGGYTPNSVVEFGPKIYINEDYQDIFLEHDIYDSKKHHQILVDTLLHEYGHLLYDMVDSDNSPFIDKMNDFLRRQLEDSLTFENVDNVEEGVLYRVTKTDGQILEFSDEDELADYLEYETEELFAEDLVAYFRLKENDEEYLNFNKGLKLSEERARFYKVVFEQVEKMKEEYFEEDPNMKLQPAKKIEFTKRESEDETQIIVYHNGEAVGHCEFEMRDMDTFVQYEIDEYLDNRMEEGDIEGYEVDKYMELKDKIKDKSMVYLISNLSVSKEYRGKGFGKKLLGEVLKYISQDTKKYGGCENIVYLNASPSYDSMGLSNLIKFYKSLGFEDEVLQSNNCLMSILEMSKLDNLFKETKRQAPGLKR